MKMKKLFSIIGAFGVIFSAFGSHYLKNKISISHQQIWNTASLYLFIHVIIGLYAGHFIFKQRSQYLFLGGIFLFSGSLYLLALFDISFLGFVTPIGGVLFILGWLCLAFDLVD